MEFTEDKKKEVEQAVVDICLTALEKNTLTQEQLGDISFFVLERIDYIKTQDNLIVFLEMLAGRWPIFEGLLEIEKGKKDITEEKLAAEQVEELIKQGNLDQALKLAKNANQVKE